MPHPRVRPEFGSPREVGNHFGYSADTIERLIEAGALTAYRLGGTGNRRVRYDDVEALLVADRASA